MKYVKNIFITLLIHKKYAKLIHCFMNFNFHQIEFDSLYKGVMDCLISFSFEMNGSINIALFV